MMKMQNRKTLSIITAVLLAALLLAPMAGATEAGQSMANITVNGTGTVTIKPDMATVSVGVANEDKDANKAQKANNKAAEKLVEAIKTLGVADENIVTENFSLYPNYDYSTNTPKITGYTASHQLSVTVLDVDRVGDVINAAVDAGANQSYGITFGVLDESAQYQEALKLAVDAAMPKAKAIAAASGQTLGDIVSIIEGGSASPVRYANSEAWAVSEDSGMPVQSGTLDIRANVTIVFAVQ